MHVLSSAFRFERIVWEKKTITQSWQGGDGYLQFSYTNGREGRADLLHFVDRIESGDFEDQENPEQLQIFELKTLCIALMGMSDHSSDQIRISAVSGTVYTALPEI